MVNQDTVDWGKGFKLKYELGPSGFPDPPQGSRKAELHRLTGCFLCLEFTNLQTRVWVNVIIPSTSLSLRFTIHG